MVEEKEIKWTLRAIQDKIDIFEYWIGRNQSTRYCEKLDRLFDHSLKLAIRFPQASKKTDYKDVRIKVVKHYLIFFWIKEDCIEVIRIRDARQDVGGY